MSLRAAVVGVGYLGAFHAQKYKALCTGQGQYASKVNFVGVCDLNQVQVQKVAQDLGVLAFARPEELLGKVDMVSIASVTSSHYQLAKFFLENGIHVNVEKPICTTAIEGTELVYLAKTKGLVFTVGHSERFNPAYLDLKKQIRSKRMIELSRQAPFKARGADVSVIHDLMIHDLDLLLSLDSSQAKLLMASGGKLVTSTYDWAQASLEFESGLKAVIQVSRMSPTMIRTMKLIQRESIVFANLQTGDLEKTYVKYAGATLEDSIVEVEKWNAGRGDNLLTETDCFIKSVLTGAPCVISGEDGLKALKLAEMIIDKIESSQIRE